MADLFSAVQNITVLLIINWGRMKHTNIFAHIFLMIRKKKATTEFFGANMIFFLNSMRDKFEQEDQITNTSLLSETAEFHSTDKPKE